VTLNSCIRFGVYYFRKKLYNEAVAKNMYYFANLIQLSIRAAL